MRSKLATYSLSIALIAILICLPFAVQARGFDLLHRVIQSETANVSATPPAGIALPPAASFDQCRGFFPAASPSAVRLAGDGRGLELCFNNFAVLYSPKSKTPTVVVERLSAATLAPSGSQQRTDVFFADPRIPANARAELSDYKGSGLQRGHMAPAADQVDGQSMGQSFALSNMVPQDPHHNEKVWSQVEKDSRRYIRRAQGDVYIFTGPIFSGSPQTIGRNRVWVPSYLFKLVYDAVSGRAWAYVQANSASTQMGPPVPYEKFVEWTGMDLLRGLPVTGSIANR